jgi:hypothetical protein
MKELIDKLTYEEQQQIRQMVRRLFDRGEDTPQASVMAVAVDELVSLKTKD